VALAHFDRNNYLALRADDGAMCGHRTILL
jgi:hypothetical protein